VECLIYKRKYEKKAGMRAMSPSDEINAMLIRKEKAVGEFLSATKLLQQALESDDQAAVTRSIKRREELMPVIDEIDHRISLCRQKDEVDRDPLVVQQVAKTTENLSEKLKKIVSANQQCHTLAASRCEALKKEMATIHQSEEGLHVYAGKTQGIPKFLSVRM
jgi:tetrahydromethanopterin S-methyltransferase subunit A